MNRRETPRTLPPDSPVFCRAELARGPHHLRVTLADFGALQAARAPLEWRNLEIGYWLGRCWASEWWDLETYVPRYPEDREARLTTGEAVLDELQAARYTFAEISQLWTALLNHINAQITATPEGVVVNEEAEARNLADFTGVPKGSEPSGRPTSGSSTSETPAGSTSSTGSAA